MNYRLSSTTNLLTIDVAGWYRDPAVASAVRSRPVEQFSEREASVVDKIVDDLAAAGARATFFVEAAVATATKNLTRRLTRAGHEVAALGVYAGDDLDEFREDVRIARLTIEEQTGVRVHGFRSPRSRKEQGSWRFDVLIDEGFDYDSSRFAGYTQSFVCGAGSLVEVPLTAGISLRRSSYGQVRSVLESRTRAALPAVASFATWEMDVEQPKVRLPMLASIRHYSGRRAASDRMRRMLGDFRFDAIAHRLTELAQSAPQAFAA